MEKRWSIYLKNAFSITALLLSLAALQGPLWRSASAGRVTAKSGGTVLLNYDGDLEKAAIFEKRTATLSSGQPGQLVIHGHKPGKTSLLLRYKDGDSMVYEVVVLPG
jgi:hypothetical protein